VVANSDQLYLSKLCYPASYRKLPGEPSVTCILQGLTRAIPPPD